MGSQNSQCTPKKSQTAKRPTNQLPPPPTTLQPQIHSQLTSRKQNHQSHHPPQHSRNHQRIHHPTNHRSTNSNLDPKQQLIRPHPTTSTVPKTPYRRNQPNPQEKQHHHHHPQLSYPLHNRSRSNPKTHHHRPIQKNHTIHPPTPYPIYPPNLKSKISQKISRVHFTPPTPGPKPLPTHTTKKATYHRNID